MAEWNSFFVCEVGAASTVGGRPAYRFREQSKDAANAFVEAIPGRGQNDDYNLFDINDRVIPPGVRVFARHYGAPGGAYKYECCYIPGPDDDITYTGTVTFTDTSTIILDGPDVNVTDSVTWTHSPSTTVVYQSSDGGGPPTLTTWLQVTTSAGGVPTVTLGGPTVPVIHSGQTLSTYPSPTTISGNTNNLTPATWGPVIPLNPTGNYTLTGLAPPTGAGTTGRMLRTVLLNTGSGTLTLPHLSTSSTSANRFKLPGAQPLLLSPGAALELLYYPEAGGASTPHWELAESVSAGLIQGIPISTTAPTDGQVYAYVAGTGLLTPTTPSGGGGASGVWTKYTLNYNTSGLNPAATTGSANLVVLGSNAVIEGAIIKTSTAWTGGSLSAVTAALRTAGASGAAIASYDLMAAVGNTNYAQAYEGHGSGYMGKITFAGWTVSLDLTATGDNLSAATAGSVDVWLRVATLP